MIKRCLLVLILLSWFTASFSAQLYKVEVIVFSKVTAAALNSEQWPANPNLPSMDRVVDLLPAASGGQAYQALPSSQWSLRAAANKLAAAGYTILNHATWIQPGVPIRNARRIHFSSEPTGPHQAQLNGYIRMSQPYLFQMDANLVLTLPQMQIDQLSGGKVKTNQFVLQQTLRLKLGKVYYVDHPLLGILIRVTRY